MTSFEPDEPTWLIWAREMQALAQTGLAFTKDPYDRERYESLRALAARIVANHTAAAVESVLALFAAEAGYATPKIDVRAAVFRDGRILMVREVVDEHRWTLPGGFADVNLTPAENVVKEVREESGFDVRVTKLAAIWDRRRQGHPAPSPFHIYKLFFLCDIVGGAPATSLETSEVGFFAAEELPPDLSLGRILPHQITRMFEHARTPARPTDFD